jgi:hypothetical protein
VVQIAAQEKIGARSKIRPTLSKNDAAVGKDDQARIAESRADKLLPVFT